ncbi:hypothetical protein BFR04_07205 [Gaetbulibacter sp. 4G1]|nr:glycosyltransferase family A protein [Gaetbulibacter sp. 4G1]PIA78012.1 hypothetical protein BFR04_07205 [Gaetbulibacter sp. 4G1]
MISIVVPLYNQSSFLDEALLSVFNQTLKSWECIIINDGSTDNSEEKALEWTKKDSRFVYYYKQNGGLSSARNFGINKANYEIILPLDSDDKIHPDLLVEILDVFKNQNADVVHYNTSFFGTKTGMNHLPKYDYKSLLLQNCFIACTPFKKDSFNKINGYDESLSSFEDWDFWIRLLNENSKVFKIEKTLYYYRKHASDSLTNVFAEKPKLYFDLYDQIYIKNKHIYDKYFKNPILAYQENALLIAFNNKVKNTLLFKFYSKLKKLL